MKIIRSARLSPDLTTSPLSADPHHTAQTWEHDPLLEPSNQTAPFGDHRYTAVPGVELLLELPAELRDVRADLDVALLELLHDAVGQQGHAEARPRQIGRFG